MIRSEVDILIENITLNSKKIFVFKQEFIPDNFIEITRTGDNQLVVTQKTVDIANLVDKVTNFIIQDELKRLLITDQLKEHHGSSWYMDFMSFKTKGCNCGGWATSNPDLHSFDCRKYIKIPITD